jgi:integrase
LIGKWSDGHLAGKRPKYAREAARALRYGFAKHLKRPAVHLTRATVRSVLDALVERGNGPMALRTAAYGRSCFNWAISKEHVSGNPFADLKLSAEENSRERVLTEPELGEIWEAATELGYPFGHWTRFALLTLQRGRQEVAAMRWGEVSPDRRTWEVPGTRMKNGKAHFVHLASPARELLQSIEPFPGSDLVFTTNGLSPISGFGKAKAALDKITVEKRAARAKESGQVPAPLVPWTLHDFRRTGASWLAEREFDTVAIDRLLAHRPTKLRGVANVYQKAELLKVRERALDAWGAFVAGLLTESATVIPFNTKAGA